MRTMHLFAGHGGGLLADLILGHTPVVAVEWDGYACRTDGNQTEAMKPRLFRYKGLWHCFSGHIVRAGIGYTPQTAYADWVQIERSVT